MLFHYSRLRNKNVINFQLNTLINSSGIKPRSSDSWGSLAHSSNRRTHVLLRLYSNDVSTSNYLDAKYVPISNLSVYMYSDNLLNKLNLCKYSLLPSKWSRIVTNDLSCKIGYSPILHLANTGTNVVWL